MDALERSIVQNIFWSDPTEESIDLNCQKGRFKFTREHFDAFKSSVGIDRLFRGHEAVADGVKDFLTAASPQSILRVITFYILQIPKQPIQTSRQKLLDLLQAKLSILEYKNGTGREGRLHAQYQQKSTSKIPE